MTQLNWPGHDDADVTVIATERVPSNPGSTSTPIPYCSCAPPTGASPGACIAQRAPEVSAALFTVLHLTTTLPPQEGGTGSHGDKPDSAVLHVAQPTTEPSGTVTGTP